jgi:hypothetical protein
LSFISRQSVNDSVSIGLCPALTNGGLAAGPIGTIFVSPRPNINPVKKAYPLIAVFLLLFGSCDEDEFVEPPYDYMKFDTGGQSFFVNSNHYWGNGYLKNVNNDQLVRAIDDESGVLRARLLVFNSNLLTRSFPFTLDEQSDPAKDGSAQLELIDLTPSPGNVFNEPDSTIYIHSANRNFELTMESFEKNWLRGSFHGVFQSSDGNTRSIDNGQFKFWIKPK